MTFDEYAARYSSLKSEILRLKEQRKLLASDAYRRFLNDVEEARAGEEMPRDVFLPKDPDRRLRRAWRLYRKYLIRLSRACDLIALPNVRFFAIQRYLYGLTHEEIALRGHYAVRTVYRQSREARRQMTAFLLKMMPSVRRIPRQRYRLSAVGRARICARKAEMEWRRRAPKRKSTQRPFTVRPEYAFSGKTKRDG